MVDISRKSYHGSDFDVLMKTADAIGKKPKVYGILTGRLSYVLDSNTLGRCVD